MLHPILGAICVLSRVLGGQRCVVIAQSPFEAIVPAILSVICRGPCTLRLIVESHGDFDTKLNLQHTPGEHRGKILIYRLLRPLAHWAVRRASALRGVSRATAEALRRLAPEVPLEVFPAWTNLAPFLRVDTTPPNDAPYIIFVGQVIPKKGVDVLVDAFSQLSSEVHDLSLMILGTSPDPSYRSLLEAKISESGISGRVQFRGHQKPDDLARLIRGASMLVLPSRSEGLGRVLIEAMASGIPVIGSRVGGIPDVIEHGRSGLLVPVGDIAALTQAMRTLVQDRSLSQTIAWNGSLRAKTLVSPGSFQKSYRRLIELSLRNS